MAEEVFAGSDAVRALFDQGTALKNSGNQVEALKKFDEAQQLIKQEQGENSEMLDPVYSEITIVCNVLSMAHLQREDFRMCQDLLKKAELFAEGNPRMKAITFNNLACLFRKTNKLRNALNYLEMALALEYSCLTDSEEDVTSGLKISNPCEIHLNICAILSQLGKHEQALHHAMKALVLIQDELIGVFESSQPKGQPSLESRQTVMIIALHNIAVEYEYLKQYQSALLTYQKARDFAMKMLGEAHPFSQKMESVLEESAVKIKGILERQNKRVAKIGGPGMRNQKPAGQRSAAQASTYQSGNQSQANLGNDLSTLLENGLTLDSVQEGNQLATKKTTGKNYPRANRSPRGDHSVPNQPRFGAR